MESSIVQCKVCSVKPVCNVKCTVCNVKCTVCNVKCTVCNVKCRVCNVKCTVCNVKCTVCNVNCTVCSVKCTVCNVKCTVCKVQVRVWTMHTDISRKAVEFLQEQASDIGLSFQVLIYRKKILLVDDPCKNTVSANLSQNLSQEICPRKSVPENLCKKICTWKSVMENLSHIMNPSLLT